MIESAGYSVIVTKLDETVGKRLCEAQDAILARAAEGMTPEAILSHLLQLRQDVDFLGHQMRTQRDELATEVRTRRLVVVDDDGFERIEAEARGGSTGSADIKVLCREDPDTYVSLYVSDECLGSEAGLYLAGGDAIVGMLQVQQGGVLVNLDGEDDPHFEPGSVSHEAHLRFDSHHGTRRVRLDGDGLGVESRAPRRPADGGSHATAADPLSDGPLPH